MYMYIFSLLHAHVQRATGNENKSLQLLYFISFSSFGDIFTFRLILSYGYCVSFFFVLGLLLHLPSSQPIRTHYTLHIRETSTNSFIFEHFFSLFLVFHLVFWFCGFGNCCFVLSSYNVLLHFSKIITRRVEREEVKR